MGASPRLGPPGGRVHHFNGVVGGGGMSRRAVYTETRVHSTEIDDMKGLGRRMPLTAAALVVGGLGLIGVPGTVGFVSKWYLVGGALEQGSYLATSLILLSSLLAAVYVWRVVEVMYFEEAPAGAPSGEAPAHVLLPTWILMLASVYFGFFTDLSVGVAMQAAYELLGVSP